MATLRITPKIMFIGSRMISIANIAEVALWEDVSGKSKSRKFFLLGIALIVGGGLYSTNHMSNNDTTAVWLIVSSFVFIGWGAILWSRRKYEIILQTTAGKITPLSSTDKKLLDEIIDQLNIAISHENPSQNYAVTIADNIINSVVGSSVGGNVELDRSR